MGGNVNSIFWQSSQKKSPSFEGDFDLTFALERNHVGDVLDGEGEELRRSLRLPIKSNCSQVFGSGRTAVHKIANRLHGGGRESGHILFACDGVFHQTGLYPYKPRLVTGRVFMAVPVAVRASQGYDETVVFHDSAQQRVERKTRAPAGLHGVFSLEKDGADTARSDFVQIDHKERLTYI